MQARGLVTKIEGYPVQPVPQRRGLASSALEEVDERRFMQEGSCFDDLLFALLVSKRFQPRVNEMSEHNTSPGQSRWTAIYESHRLMSRGRKVSRHT